MNESVPDALQRHLAGLRDPAPPAGLYARIQHSRRRRQQRRRLLRGGIAAVLLLAIALPLRNLWPTHGETAAPLAIGIETLPPVPAAASLERIDRQLQAAYDRGADPETLHTLWLARERAASQTDTAEETDASIISL